MAIGWLRVGDDLAGPETDASSALVERGDERVPDSVDKFISLLFYLQV